MRFLILGILYYLVYNSECDVKKKGLSLAQARVNCIEQIPAYKVRSDNGKFRCITMLEPRYPTRDAAFASNLCVQVGPEKYPHNFECAPESALKFYKSKRQ